MVVVVVVVAMVVAVIDSTRRQLKFCFLIVDNGIYFPLLHL